MPRFYFHLHDDIDALDEEGVECANREMAVARARHAARQLAADEVKRGSLHLDHRIVVVDDEGEAFATILFRDAVLVTGRKRRVRLPPIADIPAARLKATRCSRCVPAE